MYAALLPDIFLVEWESVQTIQFIGDVHETVTDASRGIGIPTSAVSGISCIPSVSSAASFIAAAVFAVSKFLIFNGNFCRIDFLPISVCVASCLDPS